jgi:pilus assembly protein Flp/PilA
MRNSTAQRLHRALRRQLVNFARDRSGATAIEYALIATLISVAIVGGALALGTALDETYTDLGDTAANPVS